MGWFDEQIRERKEGDRQALEEAFLLLSDSVTGKNEAAIFSGDSKRSQNAVSKILKF